MTLEEKNLESMKEMEAIEKEYNSYKNLENKKWGEIRKENQEELLKKSKIDKDFYKDNKVIIEFENGLSLLGKSEKNGDIKIDDKEIFSLINEKTIQENSAQNEKNGVENLIEKVTKTKEIIEKIKTNPLLKILNKQKVSEKEQGR
jgi:hypothetical protein